jgi:hypothetical protein
MVEVIVLSDDEDQAPLPVLDIPPTDVNTSTPEPLTNVVQKPKRPYKLFLVDSRRCHRMPRPRFLPVALAQGRISGWQQEAVHTSAGATRSAAEIDDEDEDPDYEDIRPVKRRRTGTKKILKKHGKLAAPDWEVVRDGEAGGRHSKKRPVSPVCFTGDRKEARGYVKRLTANVDWEEILKHLHKMKLCEVEGGIGRVDQARTNIKERRTPNPANRLKQYWQGVLTKSMLKMDAD